MPYYFHVLNPGRAVELNWCVWNNMNSPSYYTKENDPTYRQCYTQQEHCEDCRVRPIEEIALIHFTNCEKPWLCLFFDQDDDYRLCRYLHREWFKARSGMEVSWGRSGNGTGNLQYDYFFGYCDVTQGYQSIQKPYGLPLLESPQ
jgi:lipopolysaccharide biosynthesis glycosyltransferase